MGVTRKVTGVDGKSDVFVGPFCDLPSLPPTIAKIAYFCVRMLHNLLSSIGSLVAQTVKL